MIGAARLLKCLAARQGMIVIVVNHIVGTAQVQATYAAEHCQDWSQHSTCKPSTSLLTLINRPLPVPINPLLRHSWLDWCWFMSTSDRVVSPLQDRRPALGDHWLPQPHTRVHLQRQQVQSPSVQGCIASVCHESRLKGDPCACLP
jgi:hypothetical protein